MTNQKPLIISFYTIDWEYPNHAKRMQEDCTRLGLDFYIVEKSSTHDYIKNTAIKPFFIKETLEKFKRPVLWVDVDGLLLKDPGLENLDSDFAATPYQNSLLDRDWTVSILWFNYSEKSMLLVNEWCKNAVNKTDEAAFDITWKSLKSDVTVTELPLTYCFQKWRDSLVVPEETIFCNQLSKFEDKLRRKNKSSGQIKDD
jgi:hypothetical protein